MSNPSVRFSSLLLAAAAALTLSLGTTSSASAGKSMAPWASCRTNLDGSGSCSGTLRGFQEATEPDAYAELGGWIKNGKPIFVFDAHFNNKDLRCTVTDVPLARDFIATVAGQSSDDYFRVEWDAAKHCNQMEIYRASRNVQD